MPSVLKGESRAAYLQRCVPIVIKEGKTNEQAVGQCEGMYDSFIKNETISKQLQTFTINVDGSAVREDKLEGETYWVAPIVMMTECVANGSQGPLYYPEDELQKWAPAWNYKPIVAPNHPTEGSACTQDFLSNHKIGVVLNADYDGKQRAYGWFHQERTRKIEPRVANALETGRMMEVSTGLYVDPDGEPGVFNGTKYVAIARNHRPDHLAVLPDKIGACSIKMGAGLLQLNEQSHEEMRMKMEGALHDKHKEDMKKYPNLYGPYVRSMFQDHAIYSFGGKLYKHDYTATKDKVSLKGDAQEVMLKEDYVPIKNQEKESQMTKKELIDALIANSFTQWKEDDRKALEAYEEKQLAKLLPDDKAIDAAIKNAAAEAIKKDLPVDDKKEKKPAANEQQENPAAPPAQPTMNADQWLQSMPDQFKPVYNDMTNAYNTEKGRLIQVIVANKANQFKAEELQKFDIPMLRNMAALAATVDQQTDVAPSNFSFMGPVPQIQNAAPKTEVLNSPVYNREKFART